MAFLRSLFGRQRINGVGLGGVDREAAGSRLESSGPFRKRWLAALAASLAVHACLLAVVLAGLAMLDAARRPVPARRLDRSRGRLRGATSRLGIERSSSSRWMRHSRPILNAGSRSRTHHRRMVAGLTFRNRAASCTVRISSVGS